VTVVLSLFMAANFADKAAFGLAAVPIMREMHLSSTTFGLLGSSFFLLFALSAVAVGRLGDRVSTTWLLPAMAIVWSAAQLPLLAPVGLAAFFGCRILLGAGEGPALPVALHAAYARFPDAQRPLVTAVVEAGVPLGSALAALAVTRMIATSGWHVAFAVLGIVSLVWACAWPLCARWSPEPRIERAARAADVPVRVLIGNRTLLGVMAAGFCGYWVSALAVVWLPSYLQVSAGLTEIAVGTVLTVAWLVQIPLFLAVGWFSGYLTGRGASSNVARAGLATAGLAVGGAAMLGLGWATSAPVSIVLTALCLSSTVVVVTLLPPIVAEVAPDAQRSTGLGVCLAVASLGGVLGPLTFGRLIDAAGGGTAGYRVAFLASGALVVVATLVAQALMRPREDAERIRQLTASAP